jgi:hypothetical protein
MFFGFAGGNAQAETYIDNFDRTALGNNWTVDFVLKGKWTILEKKYLYETSKTRGSAIYYNQSALGKSFEIKAIIGNNYDRWHGVVYNWQAPGNGYCLRIKAGKKNVFAWEKFSKGKIVESKLLPWPAKYKHSALNEWKIFKADDGTVTYNVAGTVGNISAETYKPYQGGYAGFWCINLPYGSKQYYFRADEFQLNTTPLNSTISKADSKKKKIQTKNFNKWEIKRARLSDRPGHHKCPPCWKVTKIQKEGNISVDISGDNEVEFIARGYIFIGKKVRLPRTLKNIHFSFEYQTYCGCGYCGFNERSGVVSLIALPVSYWDTLANTPRTLLLHDNKKSLYSYIVHPNGKDVLAWTLGKDDGKMAKALQPYAGKDVIIAIAWVGAHNNAPEWAKFRNLSLIILP